MHPSFSSMGAFFKSFNIVSIILIILTTIFLIATAIANEQECIARFGNSYRDYMKKTKRFIPFVF